MTTDFLEQFKGLPLVMSVEAPIPRGDDTLWLSADFWTGDGERDQLTVAVDKDDICDGRIQYYVKFNDDGDPEIVIINTDKIAFEEYRADLEAFLEYRASLQEKFEETLP